MRLITHKTTMSTQDPSGNGSGPFITVKKQYSKTEE